MNGHAPYFEVEDFADPAAALARVHEIYDLAVDHLRRGLQHYVDGADVGAVTAFGASAGGPAGAGRRRGGPLCCDSVITPRSPDW